MRIVRKFIVEKADGTWVPLRETTFKKVKPDKFGRVSLYGGSYFLGGVNRPTNPYPRHPPLPWPVDKDEVHLFAEGNPCEVPRLRDFPNLDKMMEKVQFTSEQMELLAREKETEMYLHSTPNWIMLLAGIGIGGMIAAIAMYALQIWQQKGG